MKLEAVRGPAVAVVLGVVLCLLLGTWQLYRLQWKRKLIDHFTVQLHQPLQDIFSFETLKQKGSHQNRVTEAEKEALNFQPLKAEGTFDRSLAFKLQGRPLKGKDGYHLIMPFRLQDGSWILVDRGWLPQHVPVTLLSSPQKVVIEGYLRWQSDVHFMTPSNTYDHHTLFSIQPLEAAAQLKKSHSPLWPFYLVQTSNLALEDGMIPQPAKKELMVRNSHFQYALTWYSLAVVLLTFYGIYQKNSRSKPR